MLQIFFFWNDCSCMVIYFFHVKAMFLLKTLAYQPILCQLEKLHCWVTSQSFLGYIMCGFSCLKAFSFSGAMCAQAVLKFSNHSLFSFLKIIICNLYPLLFCSDHYLILPLSSFLLFSFVFSGMHQQSQSHTWWEVQLLEEGRDSRVVGVLIWPQHLRMYAGS